MIIVTKKQLSIILLLIILIIAIIGGIKYIVEEPIIKESFNEDDGIHVSIPDYSIQEIEGFLTNDECDTLIKIASTRLEPSRVYTDKEDLNDENNRKSDQAWLTNNIDPLIKKITEKVSKLSGYPTENQEDLQVVHYEPGGFFKAHYDACEGTKEFCQRMDGNSGPRLWTYLIYLNDDLTGGETVFPYLNKSVIPKKGKMILFQSTDDNGLLIRQSLHGGEPVTSGVKWIANKWVRLNTYVG